jgi:hypothetical protein
MEEYVSNAGSIYRAVKKGGRQHTMGGALRIEGNGRQACEPGIAIIIAAGGGEATREQCQGSREPTLTQRVGSSKLGWLHAW